MKVSPAKVQKNLHLSLHINPLSLPPHSTLFMIDIQFVGTGGAFDVEQGNSAALITFKGKKILLDCGHSVYPRLRQKGLAGAMDYILLTHLHDDHVGSLSTLIFHQKYAEHKRAKILHPTADFGDLLFAFLAHSQQKPAEYSDFLPLWQFSGGGISYIDTTGMHAANMPTFAYLFEDEEEILCYSGDIGNPYLFMSHFEKYPTHKKIRIFNEIIFYPNIKSHCYYKDLALLASKYEVYAYHVNHLQAPDDNEIPLVGNFPQFLL